MHAQIKRSYEEYEMDALAPPTGVDTILATRLDEHTGDWRKSDGSSRHEESFWTVPKRGLT